MQVLAKARFIRMSPRKVRLVVDLVRNKKTDKALDQLKFVNKAAALPISKLINSAIANAVNNFELDKDNLYIKEIKVDEGPTLKRWMPRAHGRATPLRKRTSHISVTLGEIKDSGVKKAKKQKVEAPVKIGEKPKQEEEKTAKAKDEAKPEIKEQDKEIIDPRGEGKGKHTKIEGGAAKGFKNKIFRRKSG
ncbi:MAG: 50S ribosomal protein L22 [bacterium]